MWVSYLPKYTINGGKLTDSNRSLLSSEIIRQRIRGRKDMFKMGKLQNGASIHKTDHATVRLLVITLEATVP